MRRFAGMERVGHAVVAAGLATLLSAPVQAQEHEPRSSAPRDGGAWLGVPESIHREHAELRAELARAIQVGGDVGDAAREVTRVLDPQLRREEEIALPPLGLLRAVFSDEVSVDLKAVLPMTDTLKLELPRMLEEHVAICGALERLRAATAGENRQRYAQLAERIMLHLRVEEEVVYPAAILAGEYVRLLLIYSERPAVPEVAGPPDAVLDTPDLRGRVPWTS